MQLAVETLGNLLPLTVTPSNEQERSQVAGLAQAVQEATGTTVEVAYVDEGYTGEAADQAAAEQGIKLVVVKHTTAKQGLCASAEAVSDGADVRLAGPFSAIGEGR